MRITVLSLFPELIATVARFGVLGRALDRGLLELATINPRDFTDDPYRSVDDRPFGGGPGMVMRVEPLERALEAARADRPGRVILLTPQGQRLTQSRLAALAKASHLILVCARYEGVDERFVETFVDEELSIGDYVLSGGELPALVLIDGLARLREGVLGDARSAEEDSFSDGLLDCPHYTRPAEYRGRRVPEVLLSGDHAAIRRWRRSQALLRTWYRRPDLLMRASLSEQDRALLAEAIEAWRLAGKR
ncbi:MAG: tRNA (guanine-N(1)-)-methyltransferase [Lysobacterales bacterium]|jgi:tRNA (guanine37-N1)-methyltransferase|nr:MAG: tRNA (guanine-N(1)-)-methyltransferase [Xanthomonadales bacterium]